MTDKTSVENVETLINKGLALVGLRKGLALVLHVDKI
jgi:hypothetical protein